MWNLLMFGVCLGALAMLVLSAEFVALRVNTILGHRRSGPPNLT